MTDFEADKFLREGKIQFPRVKIAFVLNYK